MTQKHIRNALHLIVEHCPNSLKAVVANEALKRGDTISFFKDLRELGCISGMVSSLNHYPHTHQIFETYYEDIEQLRLKYLKHSTELICEVEYDLKTALVWFAFEQTALELSLELDMEKGI